MASDRMVRRVVLVGVLFTGGCGREVTPPEVVCSVHSDTVWVNGTPAAIIKTTRCQ